MSSDFMAAVTIRSDFRDQQEEICHYFLLFPFYLLQNKDQSILKKISPEYSLGGLMLKLKLQYFGYLMERANSLEKMLMLGKIEGKRRRGQQRMGWLDNSKGQGSLACCSSWGRKESNMTLASEQ